MNAKKLMIAIAAVASISTMTFAGDALARGGYGMGGGAGCMSSAAYTALTPEKKAAADKLLKAQVEKVAPLREKLMAKSMELQALSGNPNMKPEDIKAMVAEITSLRAQLRTEQVAFSQQFEKETGLVCNVGGGNGRGMGYGMGGQGHGGGHGGHGMNGGMGRGVNGQVRGMGMGMARNV